MFSRYEQNAIERSRALFLILFTMSGVAVSAESLASYSQGEFAHVISPQEVQIDKYRTEEIQQLQSVLSRNASHEQDADMVLRLAELYTEKYKLLFSKENDIWSQHMDAYLRKSVAQQRLTKRPILDTGLSKQWLKKAISTLEHVPGLDSPHARMDEVHYFLGFSYWELGKKDEAVRNFRKIVKNYPRSKFSAEAHRYIADSAFAHRNFSEASTNYEEAAKFANNPSRPRVLYGLAWSQFKLKKYSAAVETMGKAIALASKEHSSSKTGLGLEADALDSLAIFYSEGGSAKNAASYFANILSKADTIEALRKLASSYQHEGRYAQALEINKQLVDLGGQSATVGDGQRYQIMIDNLRVAENQGDSAKVVQVLKQIVLAFVSGQKNPDEDRVEEIRLMVRKTALLAHQEGNKSKNPRPALARSEELYRLYLSAFSTKLKPEDSAEVHYLLGDALSQQEKYRMAATEFKGILDAGLANPNDAALKKYQKDSALNLIYSLDAFFKAQHGKALGNREADELIAAIDTYLRLYPKDKDAPKYYARIAGILVTSNRMAEARPRLLSLSENYPASKEAMDAAITLIKDCEARNDYQAAAELSQKMLQNAALLAQDKKGTIRAQLQSIATRAQFNQVQTLEKGNNFAAAAQRYEQLSTDAKDNEVRYKALHNAALSYAHAGDSDSELRVLDKILAVYLGDEQATRDMLGIANERFLRGMYESAATLFERVFTSQAKKLSSMPRAAQARAIEALRGAALLRRALGQGNKAHEDFRQIVDQANSGIGPARNAAEEFLHETALNLQQAGNATEAVRYYQQYVHAFPNEKYAIDSTLALGILYGSLQEEEKSQNYLSTVISKVKSKRRHASAGELADAAQARLVLLAPLENAFSTAPLRLPEAQLKADINAKLSALDRLNKGYIEVIEYGDGNWGVEAFRRMALAYRDFAQKLENAPVPTELSAEDKAKFRAQLRNVAAPVFVKANETLENALKKGETLSVPGEAMAKVYILSAVSAARPDRYPLIQDLSWANPAVWIMGDRPIDEANLQQSRNRLLAKSDDLVAWIAIGNWHALHGQMDFAKIFYLKAIEKNSKYVPAINNLAYLDGVEKKIGDATAGFKAALNYDEFAPQPKKNIARIYMASGLWRHANLAYRQLDVRIPNDGEVRRGLGLSYLAIGRIALASPLSPLFVAGDDVNARFASAILALARGEVNAAHEQIKGIANQSESANLLSKNWNFKEGN